MGMYEYLRVVLLTMALLVLVLLLDGVERRLIKARIQSRVGPSIFQTFYDIIKLVRKGVIVPATSSAFFLIAPSIAFAMSVASLMLIPYCLDNPLGFDGDIIMLVYLLTSVSIVMVLGGAASGNPFSEVSCSRELSIIPSSELLLAFSLATLAVKYGSLNIVKISTRPVYTASLILTYAALLYYVFIKSARTPYDIAEAEPEIASGYMIEYSGFLLALIILSNLVKRFVVTSLFVVVSLGPLINHLITIKSPLDQLLVTLLNVAASAAAYIALGLISSVYGRYRVIHAIDAVRKFTLISLVALVLAIVGL